MAVNSGELHGVTNSWESFKSTWVKEVESGELVVLALAVPKRHPDIPNVPLIIDFVKTDDAKKLVQVAVHDYSAIARPYVFPPGTPKDRVKLLRKALPDTYKEPEFIADVKKARLDINPITGEDLEKIIARTYALEKPLVEKLKEILK